MRCTVAASASTVTKLSARPFSAARKARILSAPGSQVRAIISPPKAKPRKAAACSCQCGALAKANAARISQISAASASWFARQGFR